MRSQQLDRNDEGRFLELFGEFDSFVKNLHGLYFDSLTGYQLISKHLTEEQETVARLLRGDPEAEVSFQETCHLPHSHIVGENPTFSWLYVPTQAELKNRNGMCGENEWRLGNYSVVIAYAYWECHLRREVALALEILDPHECDNEKVESILSKHVSSDFWGSLGYFRNSILHANGKASSKISAYKLYKWFKPDDPIRLDKAKMREIFLGMIDYRNELHSKSLADDSFPITPN